MKIAVEPWAPEYGSPLGVEALDDPTDAVVDVEVEVGRGEWKQLAPGSHDLPRITYFIDGVRRIDARVWITLDDGETRPGICATFAAGVARCGDTAEIHSTRVERRLIARAGPTELRSSVGVYLPRAVPADDLDSLMSALQVDMRAIEASVARSISLEEDAVIVFDGPIGNGRDVQPAIGYIKTHRVAYLETDLAAVIPELEVGKRTPVFLVGEKFTRYTWYARLPTSNPGGNPWGGIVRCEASGDMDITTAKTLADFSCTVLPRFAAEAHKDPRAPQNLYPIAALERELQRRMGHRQYVERELRAAGWRHSGT